MKKVFILFISSINFAFGQSITITPSNDVDAKNIIKTGTAQFGLEHTDGTVRLQTYVNKSSINYLGGWLQTDSNHPLVFSTNNELAQLYLNNNGNIILNPSDGKTGKVGIGLIKTVTPNEFLTLMAEPESDIMGQVQVFG